MCQSENETHFLLLVSLFLVKNKLIINTKIRFSKLFLGILSFVLFLFDFSLIL